MLLVLDFDGTVTARDTNVELTREFAPELADRFTPRLAAGELSVREVLAAQFGAMRTSLDAVTECACRVPVRAGFTQLLDLVAHTGDELVLVSSGFRPVIDAVLAREGAAGRMRVIANDLRFDEDGRARIDWRPLPMCDACGEQCKRHDVERLRAELGADQVVFVGDGYSDRCGAEAADRILARDSLARHLRETNVTFEPWTDFLDVISAVRAQGEQHA